MPVRSQVFFTHDDKGRQVRNFIGSARLIRGSEIWHCLYTTLDPVIGSKQSSQNIISAFIETSFKDADNVRVFWLPSGQMFIFFRGPVRAVIKDYESLLDFVAGEGPRPEYHFFWELQEFYGHLDQIMAPLEESPVPSVPAGEEKNEDIFKITSDLQRQRSIRYKPLLLIVEDDRVTRHVLQAAMEKYCDILVAWTARQAEYLYQKMLPNIVLLDIELPDGDGQDLAELFCARDPDSFVAMVSGALSNDKIERCIAAGVKGCIPKPAGDKELLNLINQYHQSRQRKSASG